MKKTLSLVVIVCRVGVGTMNAVYLALKESAGQPLFYRQDKMEESPGSIGQGAR